jgi:hypothetical protein
MLFLFLVFSCVIWKYTMPSFNVIPLPFTKKNGEKTFKIDSLYFFLMDMDKRPIFHIFIEYKSRIE